MSSSLFASRHRKNLSTDMIRTKIAHRKSISQKENRHKEYERNRNFGLKDSNIPILEGRILVELDETLQELVPEKANVKTRSTKAVLGDQRKQMLQKYKEEKQLQKLREQREKAKRGVFKVGLYRPDMPSFLLSLSNKNAVKVEPKKAVPSSVRITRSKAKDQMEQAKIDNGSDSQAIQLDQRLTSEKKVLDKEKKAIQPVVTTSVRMTRSATQAAKQTAKTVSSTTIRKPVSRAINDNETERKATNKGRSIRKIETKPDKDISFKIDSEENILDSQTSTTNGMDPDGALLKMESLPKANIAKMRGKNSFAPKDFMFQPLDGLKTYQATPMTPRSANAFLTPSYTWTPLKTEVDKTQETTKEILAQKCKTYPTETVQQGSNKLPNPLGSLTAWSKEHVLNENETTTKNSKDLPIKEVIPSLEINGGQISQPQHDVPYFRNILQSETEKLTSHCLLWDQKLELDIPDDAKDLIRTAVGQTRLLMKERFKQFEGLVNDCEYKRGEKETTCTDLDGFWDMVSFQIEDVNQKFNNLSKLEESGWQNNNNNTSKKTLRKKVVSGIASKAKQDDGRIAARNRLAAIKNAMRDRIKQEEHAEAATSLIPKEVDKIVFDAGFFKIESPVKSFSGLSISSEHLSQRLRTPKSASKAGSQSKAKMGLLRQPTMSPQNPDPQSTKSEHPVDKKTLFSNIPEKRISMVEDAQCPGFQDLIEVNHDTNKKEEISDVVEGMELNSSVIMQDVLMYSPEKIIPLQNNISQEEETKTYLHQSVLSNDKSLTIECQLLDSPGLNCSNPFTHVERKHQEHGRHISFGGNLIAFSPLRPFSGDQPEEF
ncbi:disks large-associated protein 5 isoform X1 [Dasypus novemcinctus]|uniref:disks large-associated protein 5 isoform X1 n=1 Tax=Dasypus novemcinctus TaxID=9361 RepID=UPI00265DB587|nr:disks large-associated protein 5 isoform X1 [Dasypus novemcinctus]